MRRKLIPLNKQGLLFDEDNIHIHFPQEVFDESQFLEMAFGLCGPYVLPPNMIPVSPFLWLCTCPSKSFKQAVEITMPHCVDCESAEDAQNICVMKAEHADIKSGKSGATVINFKEAGLQKVDFKLGSHEVTFQDHHFCIYCLAQYVDKNELFESNLKYCLTIMKPRSYPEGRTLKIYCILHYDLETCRKVAK